METTVKLNTWVELDLIIEGLLSHKMSKRNAIYLIGDLMANLPERDKQEFINWTHAVKGENEDKRRLGYFESELSGIMNRSGGDNVIEPLPMPEPCGVLDVIKVAEELYHDANPDSKMDVPSHAYEMVEAAKRRWMGAKSDMTLYEWCKKELRDAKD